MFKNIILLLVTIFILSGCTTNDGKMPEQEFNNPYTPKSILILSKFTDFKAKVIDLVVRRLRGNYSIKIDDLDKIDKYNFAAYTRVLLIESNYGGKYETTENYMRTYGGVNNMILFGTVGGWESTPNVKIDAITSASTSENIKTKANILVGKIRNF